MAVVGCGSKHNTWPAHVASISGFSDAERLQIMAAVNQMNDAADQPLLILDNSAPANAYTITIQKHEAWTDSKVGLSHRSEENCAIEISSELFESHLAGFLDTTVRHEFGHCTGLGHSSEKGALMFATSVAFDAYSDSALDEFFADMQKSVAPAYRGEGNAPATTTATSDLQKTTDTTTTPPSDKPPVSPSPQGDGSHDHRSHGRGSHEHHHHH